MIIYTRHFHHPTVQSVFFFLAPTPPATFIPRLGSRESIPPSHSRTANVAGNGPACYMADLSGRKPGIAMIYSHDIIYIYSYHIAMTNYDSYDIAMIWPWLWAVAGGWFCLRNIGFASQDGAVIKLVELL